MSDAPPEIQVIYSASSSGRKGRVRVVRSRPVGATGLFLLGILNLAAAGGLYYWTWWVQDSEIYMTLMLNTPLSGVDANVSSGLATRGRTAPKSALVQEAKSVEEASKFQGVTATKVMGITAYSWLTLATIASCVLALSSGASFGRVGGSTWRWVGGLAALGVFGALGFAGYRVWAEYGGTYPVRYMRMGMGGLVLATLLLGMGLVSRVRRWTSIAGMTLILSAVGSVAALYLGQMCGAVEAAQTTPQFLGTVFGIQSAWGWVLIPISWRMSRA